MFSQLFKKRPKSLNQLKLKWCHRRPPQSFRIKLKLPKRKSKKNLRPPSQNQNYQHRNPKILMIQKGHRLQNKIKKD